MANIVFYKGSSTPTSTTEGGIYYSTSTGLLYYGNGSTGSPMGLSYGGNTSYTVDMPATFYYSNMAGYHLLSSTSFRIRPNDGRLSIGGISNNGSNSGAQITPGEIYIWTPNAYSTTGSGIHLRYAAWMPSGTVINDSFEVNGYGQTQLRTTNTGDLYLAGSVRANGISGFSEMWEWTDGNPNAEDRRGLFITLEGDKIRTATTSDSYILGIVDPHPVVCGNVSPFEWHGKYVRDVFGEYVYEDVTIPSYTDDEGNIVPETTRKQRKINPEFDPSQEYIIRTARNDYAAITSKGVVTMIDDGTCVPNSFATVGEGGIATHSDKNIAVRVLKRLDDTHVLVYIDTVFTV